MADKPLLSITDLRVAFGREPDSRVEVVHGVSFDIARGEKLALVGESGSGKSVTALSIVRLLDRDIAHYHGAIRFNGNDLLQAPEADLRRVRGREISMIFQEPMTSLNPVYPIGEQLMEPLRVHEGLSKAAARTRIIELLARTGIPEPHKRIDAYPHMLSGGQRQRVMIAMALACRPKLLLADEPTTALDVTVQLQILELLEDLQREFGMAILLITHDLNLVRRFADRVAVMQAGNIVELAPNHDLFAAPQHAYTRHLLATEPPRMVRAENAAATLLEGRGLRCHFPVKGGFFRRRIGEVRAVDNVDVAVKCGETLGIVGESGSGKSTLGMCLLRLQTCDGEILFDGRRLDGLSTASLRPYRRELQVVFQDPYASLSPRLNIEQIVGEGLRVHYPALDRASRRARVVAVLKEVGLGADILGRYPQEFSGGQRQRIAIARAMVLEPRCVLLDEPTSALDVSVQKQVLELLVELQRRRGVSYLFITHDLKVVRAVAHRLIVMRAGQLVEAGDTEALFEAPQHEYTRALLQASLLQRAEV